MCKYRSMHACTCTTAVPLVTLQSLLQGQLVHASVRERYRMWNKQKEEVEREGEGEGVIMSV